MQNEEIIEGNKLIAEFMGLQEGGFKYISDSCKFHESWDWLMPVVEKIENMGSYIGIFYKNTYLSFSDDDNEYPHPKNGTMGDSKIESTYKAVIGFIKWYNSLKKQP